ncbi:substrate-binding domain-containing protein [uncultured Mitsuokella sp.]|uniref:substrate-binding domain-containing protein n=1 Tax=uncultured Mitsuokella sp. TaxID=453120 RepID=UPI00338F74AC
MPYQISRREAVPSIRRSRNSACPMRSLMRPELTTIHLEKKRMGGIAVERLLNLIANRDQRPLKIRTNCWLVERHSVRRI